METTLWKDKNNHHLIIPNDVIEVKVNTNVYDTIIEEQIEELVAFFKPMDFRKSSDLSNYIVKHQLGYKYPDLCGYLELSNEFGTWEFEGAIAPNYYAKICSRLGLVHKKNAISEGFESYREREENESY